jgi:hypothetical protein
MRLLAYFTPDQDPFAIRAALRAAGWHQVGMRDGSLWRDDTRPDTSWPAVYAPLHPGIARAYEAAGVKLVDALPGSGYSLPPAPVEAESLPACACAAVLNPGVHLLAELAAFPLPAGCQTIAVNEAARRVAADWQLCNDGFSDPKFAGPIGEPGRISRKQFATTIATGRWFALERVGITDGNFSTTCALRCAASTGARTIYLYGHDLTPGSGLDKMTGHWDGSLIANVQAEVNAEIGRIRATGARVIHVRMVDGEPQMCEPTPPQPARRGRQRKP